MPSIKSREATPALISKLEQLGYEPTAAPESGSPAGMQSREVATRLAPNGGQVPSRGLLPTEYMNPAALQRMNPDSAYMTRGFASDAGFIRTLALQAYANTKPVV